MATNRFMDAANQAADMTNKQLGKEIASLSTFTQASVEELLPMKKDKQAFIDLMHQVEADTTEAEKIAYIQENLNSVGSIAIKLLKGLV